MKEKKNEKILLNGTGYEFLVDHNTIAIAKYLIFLTIR